MRAALSSASSSMGVSRLSPCCAADGGRCLYQVTIASRSSARVVQSTPASSSTGPPSDITTLSCPQLAVSPGSTATAPTCSTPPIHSRVVSRLETSGPDGRCGPTDHRRWLRTRRYHNNLDGTYHHQPRIDGHRTIVVANKSPSRTTAVCAALAIPAGFRVANANGGTLVPHPAATDHYSILRPIFESSKHVVKTYAGR